MFKIKIFIAFAALKGKFFMKLIMTNFKLFKSILFDSPQNVK